MSTDQQRKHLALSFGAGGHASQGYTANGNARDVVRSIRRTWTILDPEAFGNQRHHSEQALAPIQHHANQGQAISDKRNLRAQFD